MLFKTTNRADHPAAEKIIEVRDFPTVRGISPGGELQGEAQREKREVNTRREVKGTGARWCF